MLEDTKQLRPSVTVGAVIINDKNKVLIMESKKHFGRFALPAGHVEYGETLEEAVKREILEETGLNVDDISLLRVAESIKSNDYIDNTKHFVSINFLCHVSDSNVVIDQEEGGEYKWMEPQEILHLNIDALTRGSIEEVVKIRGGGIEVE